MHLLKNNEKFPSITAANQDGLLAIGGDLSVERLIYAYKHGIFPWYDASQPVLWWCPDPRMVLFPENLKVSKSMKQVLRKDKFEVTFNKDFPAVIEACAQIKRKGQDDTWITPGMIKQYTKLYHLDYAHSVEVWQN